MSCRAQHFGCVGLIMALAEILEESIDCFLRPRTPNDQAIFAEAHSFYHDSKSEHWRLDEVFLHFKINAEQNIDRSRGSIWCRQHRLGFYETESSAVFFDQLQMNCKKCNWGVNADQMLHPRAQNRTHLLKALVGGHFMQVALQRNEFSRDAYTSVHDNLPVVLSYSSQEKIIYCNTWIFYSTIFCQRKVYKVSCCSVIEP